MVVSGGTAMADLLLLSEAQMRRIEPYFHCRTGLQGWKCLNAAPVIDRDKYRRRRHALHVPDHSAAFRTLRVSPVEVSEPRDAMFNVVQIQYPIRSGRRSSPDRE